MFYFSFISSSYKTSDSEQASLRWCGSFPSMERRLLLSRLG